ncbi:hypothetical protein TTHERM_00056130 (macronuclear) [Tetrahymena thermophila SB210]|uniref:Uncharacterized protein n=1 Tax=Tetrahymena thermophila (strain SB210) TaxID=312017 RepID=I7MH74_TETTS|nr:hypothetical protein TTHERM_00056130 [Tetrahymena thermophila SB210]EAR87299.1 hypothetical protein TTHERM_00056130 [Tetrahymena thermophila SB210]|eukprot:XP_001007544.1 hypothetical protein TTHERM_00056130 [Tetrahymena thermophila SB210]
MITNSNINSKRNINQTLNIEDQINDAEAQNLGEKTKKKQKKGTSLQGRPAKASTDLRKMEEQIKKAAWRIAEFEEHLYIYFGGAQASHKQEDCNNALEYFNQIFKNVDAQNWLKQMIDDWNQKKSELIDPIGQEYVPLSDRYFLNELISNEDQKQTIKVELMKFLTIYAFQIFLRTNQECFQFIVQMLYLIYQKVEVDNEDSVGISTGLSKEKIDQILKSNYKQNEEFLKCQNIYSLLYPVMQDTYLHFSSHKKIKIVKQI